MLKAKRIFVSARLLNSRERKKKKARLVRSERGKGGGQGRRSGWSSPACKDTGNRRWRSCPRKSLNPGHPLLPGELREHVEDARVVESWEGPGPRSVPRSPRPGGRAPPPKAPLSPSRERPLTPLLPALFPAAWDSRRR